MKRLLKIGFDFALLSFIPIVTWLLLSIILDKNLINIFSITYPIQFIYYILKSIFSVGPNISKFKDKSKNAVMSGMVIGIIFGLIIFGLICLNIDKYITFMNMDTNTYRIFTLYSVIQIYFQLIFSFVLEKLYFEEKHNIANKYSIIFNVLNFVLIIMCSLIFKNYIIIITIPLISLLLFSIFVIYKQYNKFKWQINIINWIKYDSVELFNNLIFFLIFLFGLSNAFDYGAEYTLAITFVTLITDCQWDVFGVINTVAKIDISKKDFNYKKSLKNCYKLLSILIVSILILFVSLYSLYNISIKIVIIYLMLEIYNFIVYPIYSIKTCYLQLEFSALKTTTNKIFASTCRFFCSFLKTPFCTTIGQTVSSTYQVFSVGFLFRKNYKITKGGNIVKKA